MSSPAKLPGLSAASSKRWLAGWGVPLVCAVVAMLVTVLTQIASRMADGFHPSLLLAVPEGIPLADYIRGVDPNFRFVSLFDAYDGRYLWTMAVDPFARGEAHDLIDLAAYRYGHPLYSWIAMILSFGQVKALPGVFWLMSIISMGLAALLAARLLDRLGASAWWGLLVACSPGLLFSATMALTEPAQVAIVAGLLLLWLDERRSPLLIGGTVVAMSLLKEQLLLVAFALGLAMIVDWFKSRRWHWGRCAALFAGPLVLGLWLGYVRGQFSAEQKHYDDGNLGRPVTGWLETLDIASQLRNGDSASSQIGSIVAPVLLATALLILFAALIGVRRADPLGMIVVCQAVLISTLGWRTLLYPHEMLRIPSLAVALAVMLLIAHFSRTNRTPSAADIDGAGGQLESQDPTSA